MEAGAPGSRADDPVGHPRDASPGLVRAAVYERVVRASLERVWENVLDWEHLPGLHRTSFDAIECIDEGPWGWTARVISGRGPALIELRIQRDGLRYVSRTREGRGEGTEIWTYLDPLSDEQTGIRVEFWLRDRHRPLDRAGAGYVAVYERLWDEDEAMMRRRAAQLGAGARRREPRIPVDLGSLEEVRASLPRPVRFGGQEFRIVEVDGELIAHSTLCPHLLGPLEDAVVEGSSIECPWHRYRFDLRTGRCEGRPYRLARPPRVELQAGQVRLVDDRP